MSPVLAHCVADNATTCVVARADAEREDVSNMVSPALIHRLVAGAQADKMAAAKANKSAGPSAIINGGDYR